VALAFFMVSFVIALNGATGVIREYIQLLNKTTYETFEQYTDLAFRPRSLPRPSPRIVGLLGLLHRHHIPRHPRRLLVRHPNHERGQHGARHARRYMAIFPYHVESYPGEPGHRDKHHGRIYTVLASAVALFVHASEQPAVVVHGQERSCSSGVDCDLGLGVLGHGWRGDL